MSTDDTRKFGSTNTKIKKFQPTCEAKQLLEIKDGTIKALESCTLSFNGGRIVASKGDTIEIYSPDRRPSAGIKVSKECGA